MSGKLSRETEVRVAIYHLSAKVIGRSAGPSSAAAYRSGERLVDERTGLLHDQTRRRDYIGTWIQAPEHAPSWAREEGPIGRPRGLLGASTHRSLYRWLGGRARGVWELRAGSAGDGPSEGDYLAIGKLRPGSKSAGGSDFIWIGALRADDRGLGSSFALRCRKCGSWQPGTPKGRVPGPRGWHILSV